MPIASKSSSTFLTAGSDVSMVEADRARGAGAEGVSLGGIMDVGA